MLLATDMRLVPSTLKEPRLISSLASETEEKTISEEEVDSPFALGGSRLFTDNGRAIFVGLFVGAIAICIAGSFYKRQHRLKEDEVHVPMMLPAVTQSVLGSTHSDATPLPMVVQVDADVLQVSAIVLGHPRLAVINGRTVTEGDTIVVHTPTRAVALTLRVLKISDGQIDLSDGTQLIRARLSIPSPSSAKRP
jgi:hypothetical protein